MDDLEEENKKLKLENKILKERLKKYTNPTRNKKYYEKNKKKCIENANERLKHLPKEKLQEYRRTAYLKRKEKKLKEKNKSNN